MSNRVSRREALKTAAVAGAATALWCAESAAEEGNELSVDPAPLFELSPYLYMQFMEPLGTTDGSVEAAWDHARDRWRPDVVDVTRELAPPLLRWGGCFSSYYRWREGVGPRSERVPMHNILWGGVETNQVGTAEFVDFCRQVGAEPLMSVNFESDGRKPWMEFKGSVRTAGPDEAAAWVDYCNNPENAQRRAHGHRAPQPIRIWQLGNETSYDRKGYDLDTAKRRTVAFAEAMRAVDPSIQLIGWGDRGWARGMIEAAGEHLQYVAFHHMFNPDDKRQPVLQHTEYRKDPDRTWAQLMGAHEIHEAKIRGIREETAGTGMPLAMTECHFTIPGRNRCEVLSSWAAGVAYARMLNVNQRHGDVLKIATAADFCGTRWQVNAVMIPVPGGRAFMMPVARVMALYRHHSGARAAKVSHCPDGLDVVASASPESRKVFLHVVNVNRSRAVDVRLAVAGGAAASGRVFQIAAPPEEEVGAHNPELLAPREQPMPDPARWTFPAASVSAVELTLDA
ncbi:MAG: alpha-L-arabinofuranosidase [Planctomycetota bacterium]